MLLIIPYWINEILRAFALRIIFGETGVINEYVVHGHGDLIDYTV